ESGEGQSERVVLAVLDGSLCMADRGRPVFFTQAGAQEEAMMAHRGKGMRQRIVGFKRERALEQDERLGYPRRHAGIDIRLRLQDQVIGVEVIGPLSLDALRFRLAQAGLDGTD